MGEVKFKLVGQNGELVDTINTSSFVLARQYFEGLYEGLFTIVNRKSSRVVYLKGNQRGIYHE